MIGKTKTIWYVAAAVGLAGFLGLSAVSLAGNSQTLRVGRAVPDAEVTDPGGLARSLRTAAAGRDEIIIVAPNCDICAGELDRLAQEVRRAREAGEPDGIDRLLLLVIRNPGLPRATFMTAYSALIGFGLEAVFIQPGDARQMGVERVPGYVRLDDRDRIVSFDYAEAG